MTCPKCKTEQPDANECRKCGIVIAKYRAPTAAPQRKTTPRSSLSRLTIWRIIVALVMLLSIGVYAGWLVYQAEREKQQIAAAEAAERQQDADAEAAERAALQPLEKLLRQCDAGFQSGVLYADFSKLVTEARAELDIVQPTITRLADRYNGLLDAYRDYQIIKNLWMVYMKFSSIEFATALFDLTDKAVTDDRQFAVCQDPQNSDATRENCWDWLRTFYANRAHERLSGL